MEPQGGRIDDNIEGGRIASAPSLDSTGGGSTSYRVGHILRVGWGPVDDSQVSNTREGCQRVYD